MDTVYKSVFRLGVCNPFQSQVTNQSPAAGENSPTGSANFLSLALSQLQPTGLFHVSC